MKTCTTIIVDWAIIIISALAVFISIQSLCASRRLGKATIKSQKEQRKHNRLSVVPHLNFKIILHLGEKMFIEIRNNGLGPAKIKRSNVFFDTKCPPPIEDNSWTYAIDELGEDIPFT